jgi:hypothetical protein
MYLENESANVSKSITFVSLLVLVAKVPSPKVFGLLSFLFLFFFADCLGPDLLFSSLNHGYHSGVQPFTE